MTFARVNPAGWALFEVLTSAQMNSLDINMTQAVDGEGGGTYTPATQIHLDGSATAGLDTVKVTGGDHTSSDGGAGISVDGGDTTGAGGQGGF